MGLKKLQPLRLLPKKVFTKVTKKNLPLILLATLTISAVPAVAISQSSLSNSATTQYEKANTAPTKKNNVTTKTSIVIADSVGSEAKNTQPSNSAQPTNPSSQKEVPKKTGNSNSPSSPKMSPENNYPTQPSHPKPKFSITLSQPPSNNAFGFIINVSPDPNDQNVDYKWPTVSYGANGSPGCGGEIYLTGGFRQWGWNCNLYYNAQHGEYPVTFTVQATNGYGQSSTASVTGTVVYRPDQSGYENRF